MRKNIVLLGIIVGALGFSIPAQAKEVRRTIYWPVHQYMSADSVLGSYYKAFVSQYGGQYRTGDLVFKDFCRVLRTSDLLADHLNRVGIPSRQLQAIIGDLEQTEFGKVERRVIRSNMLAIDLALETIEHSFNQNHRAEFRREVLAEIPPLTSTG